MSEALIAQVEVTPEEDRARRDRFPVGAAITFEDLELAGHEGAIDSLREAEPVSWVPALGGWLVTGREPARHALHPRTATTVEAQENLVRASLGRMMLTVDGDEHARMRGALDAPFRVRAVEERFGDAIRSLASELAAAMEPLLGQGTEEDAAQGAERGVELGKAFAAPFAVRMAGQALGLSLHDVPLIDGFYADFAAAMVYDGDPEPQRRADAARKDLNELLLAELARCRREPDRSLTAALAQDGRGLSDDEIVAQLRVVMFGAIETIQASVMNTLLLLLRHPDQRALVVEDPSLLPEAVDEAVRLIPPVAFIERWTRASITLAGVGIGAHEFIGVSVLGANRDPASFADPLAFDVRRANANQALSFSFGIHACLGLHLARLQTVIAVGEILRRFPALTLREYDAPSGFAFRRPASMWMT